MREETARSALERRALSGRLAQEERRSRKQAAELERLQAAFDSQEAIGRRKQEQLAVAQRRIRELAERSSSRSGTGGGEGGGTSAAGLVAATIIAQLAARDSAVAASTTARQQQQQQAERPADAGVHATSAGAPPLPPAHFFIGVAGAVAASKALGGGAVHFGPRLGELVRRGEREGALPAQPAGRRGCDDAPMGAPELESGGAASAAEGHATGAAASSHDDGLVHLGTCFDNRDRDRVPTWMRPLLEADSESWERECGACTRIALQCSSLAPRSRRPRRPCPRKEDAPAADCGALCSRLVPRVGRHRDRSPAAAARRPHFSSAHFPHRRLAHSGCASKRGSGGGSQCCDHRTPRRRPRVAGQG